MIIKMHKKLLVLSYVDYTVKLKVDILNLEFQNQAKNIPVVLPRSPIKIWGKSVQGLLSYDRTNIDYNFIYIDIDTHTICPIAAFLKYFMTKWNY